MTVESLRYEVVEVQDMRVRDVEERDSAERALRELVSWRERG